MLVTASVLSGRVGSPGVGRRPAPAASEPPPERRRDVAAPVAARRTPNGHGSRRRSRPRPPSSRRSRASWPQRAGEEIGGDLRGAGAVRARPRHRRPGACAPIDDGPSAIDAILASTDDQAAVLAAVDDEYFRARAADVRDVGRRVAGILRGRVATGPLARGRPAGGHRRRRPRPVGGGDAAAGAGRRDRARRRRADGSRVDRRARARDPARPGSRRRRESMPPMAHEALVDGGDPPIGRLVIEPDDADLAALEAPAIATARRTRSRWHRPDGGDVTVTVTANVGSVLEAEAARAGRRVGHRSRADRAPVPRPAARRRRSPSSATSMRGSANAMGDRPVVFRTLDVGGDKPAAWQTDRPEANPALGVRGVRLGLARPELLDDQLRALVEAAARRRGPDHAADGRDGRGGPRRARPAGRDRRMRRTRRRPPVLLGVMIEVPAAALVADGLAEVADFFSIGTNDLVQYTLAADRVNPALAELATRAPAGRAAAHRRAWSTAARARGRHVAVCGEAAADPEMIPLLVGLGCRRAERGAELGRRRCGASWPGLRTGGLPGLWLAMRSPPRPSRRSEARRGLRHPSAPGSDDPGAGVSLERAGDPRRVRWPGRHRPASSLDP